MSCATRTAVVPLSLSTGTRRCVQARAVTTAMTEIKAMSMYSR
jgi:hypothetical protein